MLGDKIKELRILNKMTQKEVSEKVGVSETYINFIENNKKTPSLKILNKIAEILNTTIDILQEEKESKIDEYKAKNNIFFSKYEKLSEKNKEKINRIIEIFEEETQE